MLPDPMDIAREIIADWTAMGQRRPLPTHARVFGFSKIRAIALHSIGEADDLAAIQAIAYGVDLITRPQDGPGAPCEFGCPDPAAHAEGGHDV